MTPPVPVHVDDRVTLRAKIIDACGFTCTFCHNEGTPVTSDNRRRPPAAFASAGASGRVSIYTGSSGATFLPAPFPVGAELAAVLRDMGAALDASELHLTGGEPTLHPGVARLTHLAAATGFRVCMTSNGERGDRVLADCAAAGMDRVNFSVFGTTAEELASVQHRRYRNPALAALKIAALHRSIATCEANGLRASANIVVPDSEHAPRVHRLLDEFSPHLSVRLLNSLDRGDTSIEAIDEILRTRGAEPEAHYLTAGVSGSRTSYRLPDGRRVYVKQIRSVRLPSICSTCRYNNASDCQEGFYGVRLHYDTDKRFHVGVCIQRMDLCLPVDEFLRGTLPSEIRELRSTEYRRLTASRPPST